MRVFEFLLWCGGGVWILGKVMSGRDTQWRLAFFNIASVALRQLCTHPEVNGTVNE